ncbi:hypothetical protein M2390_002589 [Mycetocola sp. BIGb0189]|uniref:HNH endonuclease n=1 Tax=Mycetocola sp. BIGb0189 TaxID=2940604 RepID=UPI0021692BC7|nr:HNH endonuclease [Mycetocola sp. BIGb0189]MCS4277383.1 hypothetical protein [Mycetocola sp. BIGb0189]
MAITKRTRFEILRRDNYTCQYCGAKAPDVALHIDHVVPVALGGDDKPGNLIAACADCNSGKTSIQPDSPLVKGLDDRAAAYVLGMQDKMARFRADFESLDDYVYEFDELWESANSSRAGVRAPLPADYKMSLFRWMQMGIPIKAYELAIPAAMVKKLASGSEFKYMCGIVWNMIEQRSIDYSVTVDTAAIYTAAESDQFAQHEWERGRDQGILRGAAAQRVKASMRDLIRHHIDGTRPQTKLDQFGGVIVTEGVEFIGERTREHSP